MNVFCLLDYHFLFRSNAEHWNEGKAFINQKKAKKSYRGTSVSTQSTYFSLVRLSPSGKKSLPSANTSYNDAPSITDSFIFAMHKC